VNGQLRLKQPDGEVEMRARVVEYVGDLYAESGPLFSWHGRLTGHDHELAGDELERAVVGELVLDDGRALAVVVDHGLLRSV
jgi:hypothetical protein